MQSTQFICSVTLTLMLAACSDKQAPAAVSVPAAVANAPASAPPEETRASLMKAVFGKQYRPATKDALATLPMHEDRKQLRLYVVVPLTSTTLENGDTVLVAQADYSPENAEENYIGTDSIGLINVYLLRSVAGEWKVLKRHENLVYRGDNDRPGSVLFTKLAKGKPGLAIVNGGKSEFGCIRESVLLYELGDDPMRELTEGITSKSILDAACEADSSGGYWSISSKWHFATPKKPAAYDDLIMVFSGDKSSPPVNSDGVAGAVVASKVQATARYAYDGKQYRLVSGVNPIGER